MGSDLTGLILLFVGSTAFQRLITDPIYPPEFDHSLTLYVPRFNRDFCFKRIFIFNITIVLICFSYVVVVVDL